MKRQLIHLILVATLVLAAGDAFAQGRIMPRPGPVPMPRPNFVTIEAQHADVDVDGQVAVTTVEQVFRNNTGRVQEGIFLFPIPEGAGVSSFRMWMGDEEVEGEILDAHQARRIYEDIVRRSRDPGLLEFVGCGLLRARVFPIPAHGTMATKVRYEQVLTFTAGLVEYRLPMRVCGGDAERKVGELSVAVRIDANSPVKSLYSPTHDIDRRIRGNSASCGWESRNATPRDFALFYGVSNSDVSITVLTHKPDANESGYFLMLASPGDGGDVRAVAKDVVFVFDKSGSMKGDKIEQAKAALRHCVQSLGDRDRFNIITFSTTVDAFSDGWVNVSDVTRRRARSFIDDIVARGGTDIGSALTAALRAERARRPQMLVFMTDGLPTVGEKQIDRLLADTRGDNDGHLRLFCFGVGHDVNTVLLDRLASDNRGTVDYVAPDEDIEVKVGAFYDKIAFPVLSNLDIDFDGLSERDMYPRELPDLFRGTQLVLLGRYSGHGNKAVRVSGESGGKERTFAEDVTFPRRTRDNAFIARLWASRKIAYLLFEIKANGFDRELVDDVIALSLEHGIVTPYTSYLVLEEGTEHDRVMLRRQAGVRLDALEGSPAMDAAEDVMGKRREAAKAGRVPAQTPALVSGETETRASRDFESKKQAATLDDAVGETVRYVGGHRFVRDDNGWRDASLRDGAGVTEISFLSDAYFDLLDQHPEIGNYLALGPNVTFVHDGRAYRIIDKEGSR